MKYKPLPPFLSIDNSSIHGQGLFTKENIAEGTILGVTHIFDDSEQFHENLIRTPLGGFINHEDEPNCHLYNRGIYSILQTTKQIKKGEELTLDYDKYKCGRSQRISRVVTEPER